MYLIQAAQRMMNGGGQAVQSIIANLAQKDGPSSTQINGSS